jgi:hypothetical protein
MSDATSAARAPEAPYDPRHLELIEREVARHRQNALAVRLGTLGLVGGFIALHAAQPQPRYMFLAPVFALGGWMLDAHADWNVRALRALARAARGEIGPRPAPLSLDTAPWADRVSWRSALLRPARAVLFHPLTTLAAFVAIDAPRLDPDGVPSELVWYIGVSFAAFVALVMVAWSWWYDTFADAAAPVAKTAPRSLDVPVVRPGDNPFPPAPRSDQTRPFGTAVG